MLVVKKNILAIAALLLTSACIAMNWSNLVGQHNISTNSDQTLNTKYTNTNSSAPARQTTIDIPGSQTGLVQNPIIAPDNLLPGLISAMVEQGLANGTFTIENLPIELRPYVRINLTSRAVSHENDDETEPEEDQIANDYVSPNPEFKCPDPIDPGPHWQGPHARMILEEKGCPVY